MRVDHAWGAKWWYPIEAHPAVVLNRLDQTERHVGARVRWDGHDERTLAPSSEAFALRGSSSGAGTFDDVHRSLGIRTRSRAARALTNRSLAIDGSSVPTDLAHPVNWERQRLASPDAAAARARRRAARRHRRSASRARA